MRKYITSQVSILWYNTFKYLYSQREVITIQKQQKISAARESNTGRCWVESFTFLHRN